MKKISFDTNGLSTISWINDSVIDWSHLRRRFHMDGKITEGNVGFGFPFDSAITSNDGIYAVIYQKLGTKGILLKNGDQLREINRSYYQADVYEYPVSFMTAKNGRTYLIHCPKEYCRIDFEDVESGEIITDIPERKPADFFHSRFEVSSNNQFFLSKGWAWHPYDSIVFFNIEACIKNPLLLDHLHNPPTSEEICAASFISESEVLIGSYGEKDNPNGGNIAIWNIEIDSVTKPIKTDFQIGAHLIALDDYRAWTLYKYPKIINYKTGEILDKIEDTDTGDQLSSIIGGHDHLPPMIAVDSKTRNIAVANSSKLNILIAE